MNPRPFSRVPRSLLLAATGAFVGWASVLIATSPSCSRQLTVDEADEALSLSCAALAAAMTREHPELLERAVAQACQPGKTRALLARILSRGQLPDASWLDETPAGSSAMAPSPYEDAGAGR